MNTDSIMNWNNISRLLAPTAFLSPISRVLSVTVTNIIFIIPIPPTNKETPAMPPSIPLRVSMIPSKVFKMSFCSLIAKSFFPCRSMIIRRVSSIAFLTVSGEVDWTNIIDTSLVSSNCSAMVMGIYIRLSFSIVRVRPFFFATPITVYSSSLILIVFPIGLTPIKSSLFK